MMTVNEIMLPVQEEIKEFEVRFPDSMKSNVKLLNRVTQFIVKRKGKQMRPLFIFLTAKMLGKVNDNTYDAASLVELLHTASLVHDDVVDDASERRGFFSANALWRNKIAVLVGDFMLSRVLLLSIERKNVELLEIVARAVREMSEGELLQIEKARSLDITEEVYFEVIRKKTASLISTCCEVGAVSVERQDMALLMREFGELVGLAFQIKDDIFDYGTPDNIGKPTGNDIREQKMTLPIIYALSTTDKETKRELLNIVRNHNDSSKHIRRAIDIVIQAGGIDYAHKRMMEIKEKALQLLTTIPDSAPKQALIGLVEYTTLRTK
ncbi:polyprenyl synthetase family protein [Crocinitomicaceae bacterium CZZ-1]|uniref:Polyprenyl synthetase family protein n=1 Tax=Taishania pollutisoli TaxID=2766479 RepID=A0A8J6TZT2_9FLAO|nr:polyprenyl synthetase family protein [Taishania pollutisoli]MBC9812533.1 polyprenyl synthetase family protein [Taishania pollutisoli]MBX2949430.1 polyprenyl synthetase family protein [Crocinitomicaceae bacterium]NGF74509.1 polyprenyl synthetase family protein [Fluviicola sp. SGL-29]